MGFTVMAATGTGSRDESPRVWLHRPVRAVLLAVAAALLVWSMFLPYWTLHLHAPQYPQGLHATISLTGVSGDVQEIDTLNHYIGMMKLDEAAKLERAIAMYLVPLFAALALATLLTSRLWGWLLALPALVFPVGFGIDLYRWLYVAGHNLDPKAPLSRAIPPFTPTLIGEGKIAQFITIGTFAPGFYVALLASALVLISLLLRPGRSD